MRLIKTMANKTQKIIVSIWVVLITLAFVTTINPVTYSTGEVSYSPNWGGFLGLSFIITVPAIIIYKVWGNKGGKK